MHAGCYPYRRKALYSVITLPMLGILALVAVLLWNLHWLLFAGYLAAMGATIFLQSLCCAHQRCPYMKGFCPGVGGFVVPASKLALLWRNLELSQRAFNTAASVGGTLLCVIVLGPVYFIFRESVLLGVGYLVAVLVYAAVFLSRVCPVCAVRDTCPGGIASTKMGFERQPEP